MVYAIANGHHREVLIGLRRAKIHRDNGIVQIMTFPDPACWRGQVALAEPKRGQKPKAQPAPPGGQWKDHAKI